MNTEFIIGTALSVIGILVGIIIYYKQKPPKITEDQVIDEIWDHLKNSALTDEQKVDRVTIQSAINTICKRYKMPPVDFTTIVEGLVFSYNDTPPHLKKEETGKIVTALKKLLNPTMENGDTDSIEPSPITSEPVDPSPRVRGGYGKPIMDYMRDVYDGMEDGREYPLAEIKQRLSEKVKAQSGKELDKGTRDLQIKKATVNEKNRVHFGAISPDDEGRYSFFYYPDENSKDTVKKFHKGIKDNPTIYYTNGGQRESKKMSEIFNN